MPTLLIALMFFASAPFFLMPATIALWVRRPGSAVIVLINLGLWTLFYVGIRSIAGGERTGLPFLPGVVPVLIWPVPSSAGQGWSSDLAEAASMVE
jgi:hypothetical protein